MDNKERMIANLPYKSWMDGLNEERMDCKKKLYEYNNMGYTNSYLPVGIDVVDRDKAHAILEQKSGGSTEE